MREQRTAAEEVTWRRMGALQGPSAHHAARQDALRGGAQRVAVFAVVADQPTVKRDHEHGGAGTRRERSALLWGGRA